MTNPWKFFGSFRRLIYIHVLRYLVSHSNGLVGQLFFSLLSMSSPVWFGTLLPFKLILKSPLAPQLLVHILTCQESEVRCPLPFLVFGIFHPTRCWLLLVVDCKRRLSVVSMLVSSLPFWIFKLLLLKEFMER